jgi:hypothetical protein
MELKIFEELFVIAKFVNDLPSWSLIYSYLVNEFGIVRDNGIWNKFANNYFLAGDVVIKEFLLNGYLTFFKF